VHYLSIERRDDVSTEPNTALIIDTRSAEGRWVIVAGNWSFAFKREVQPFLDRVTHRLELHRGIQAKERAGIELTGFYRSSAHSRADVVDAIRVARQRRDDFLRRRPEPTLAEFQARAMFEASVAKLAGAA
jgi:hypothetical protein